MELVTGRAGSPHITAQQDRQLHQGIWGEGAYILNTGNMLEPVVQSSNKILIKDGALMYQGALFSVKVGTTDEITIDNGNQGMQRKDLVVARYTYDSEQNIESASWLVYKGTAVGSNPVLPSGISGDIQAGDNVVDVPYLAVTLEGINIVSVDVIPEVAPDIHTINTSLSDTNASLSELDEKISANNRGNTTYLYKIGYACYLHTGGTDASDVVKTLASAYRPRRAVTVSGWCRNKSNDRYFPCMGLINTDGTWSYLAALTSLNTDNGLYFIYNKSDGTSRLSNFGVWIHGAWATNTNGV